MSIRVHKGHLFKGIHREEIVVEIKKRTHVDVSPDAIELEQPIKEVGEHEIKVIAGKEKAVLKLVIQAV